MNEFGWLVIESTTRDGCDINTGPQQFWSLDDAEAEAKRLRTEHADDDCYGVEVRREAAEDAEQHGNYL